MVYSFFPRPVMSIFALLRLWALSAVLLLASQVE
jgi:hypothetical protein